MDPLASRHRAQGEDAPTVANTNTKEAAAIPGVADNPRNEVCTSVTPRSEHRTWVVRTSESPLVPIVRGHCGEPPDDVITEGPTD